MSQPAHSTRQPLAAIAELLQQAGQANQRAFVVAAGDAPWGRRLANTLWQQYPGDQRLWLGEEEDGRTGRVSPGRADALLGQERRLLVVDTHPEFSADAFAALSGTLIGGGLLLMLVPPLDAWADQPRANPFGPAPSRFIRHLARCIEQEPARLLIEQPDRLHRIRQAYPPPMPREARPPCRSEDQLRAVTAITALAETPAPRPLVITSDRGRGKSAALGIAAAQLLRQYPGYRIGVCAPRPAACSALFERAAALLPDAGAGRNRLAYQGGALQFLAPDALLAQRPELDLLLVDEAAALPVPILTQCLAHYPRLVFASTVHGYEGTGRGFALCFARILDQRAPGWQSLQLLEPIRWSQTAGAPDPLEQFVFRALLLDAEPAVPENFLEAGQGRFVELDRGYLADNPVYLRALFGLLVLAHYRTRPEDLQRLLDAPGLRLFALDHEGVPIAVLVLGREGGFEPALAEAIYLGQRRPPGHLLAQSLALHAGVPDAARYRYGRILRIGVQPALQRRGLGSRLLEQVIRTLGHEGELDAVGASFSASAELLPFWQRAGLQPVRIGLTREHTSGQHSLLVLHPLTTAGESVTRRARQRFEQHWQSLRAGPLRELDPALAEELQPVPTILLENELTAADREDIESFVHGRRGYEVCAWPIEKLISRLQAMPRGLAWLAAEDQQLLISKVLEKQDWPAIVAGFKLEGQKAARRRLREAVARAWEGWEKP